MVWANLMNKFLAGLLLFLFGFFLFSRLAYADNSVQAVILVPNDWTDRVDSQKIMDYKTSILNGLSQVQTLLPQTPFSYSNDVKVNDQNIGILDKTKLSNGDCLFDLVKSSLNLGFLNNIFGISHKGQIYIFFVVGSGDVKNCYHEPALIFQLFGGDKEVYINHDTLESLDDPNSIQSIAQQLGQVLSLSTPVSTPQSQTGASPSTSLDTSVTHSVEDCQKKGGDLCESRDNCLNLNGGKSLGDCGNPNSDTVCCKYVTFCSDTNVDGQCFNISSTDPNDPNYYPSKDINDGLRKRLNAACPIYLDYINPAPGNYWGICVSKLNATVTGSEINFNTNLPSPSLAPSSSLTPTPSASPSPTSVPDTCTSTSGQTCNYIDKADCLGAGLKCSSGIGSCPNGNSCIKVEGETSSPTPTQSETSTASPVKKTVTKITVINGPQVIDITSNPTQEVSLDLSKSEAVNGAYQVRVQIDYSDGSSKFIPFNFIYQPDVNNPSPTSTPSLSPSETYCNQLGGVCQTSCTGQFSSQVGTCTGSPNGNLCCAKPVATPQANASKCPGGSNGGPVGSGWGGSCKPGDPDRILLTNDKTACTVASCYLDTNITPNEYCWYNSGQPYADYAGCWRNGQGVQITTPAPTPYSAGYQYSSGSTLVTPTPSANASPTSSFSKTGTCYQPGYDSNICGSAVPGAGGQCDYLGQQSTIPCTKTCPNGGTVTGTSVSTCGSDGCYTNSCSCNAICNNNQ